MSLCLHHQRFSLELQPDVGGSVSRFTFHYNAKDIEIFRRATAKTVLDMSMFPMLPYCGRIRENQFRVGEKIYQLKPNFGTEPLACHGDGWVSAWTVDDVDETSATLSLESSNPPYTFKAWQSFELLQTGLRVTLRIVNLSPDVMPFGLGFHPYFNKAGTTLQMKSSWVWLEGPQHLPSEYVTTPPELSFDTFKTLPKVWRNMCYSGWDGVAYLQTADFRFRMTSSAQHVQLYTPPGEDYFCLEPQSHCVNAFNLFEQPPFDSGVQLLEPGQEIKLDMKIEVV